MSRTTCPRPRLPASAGTQHPVASSLSLAPLSRMSHAHWVVVAPGGCVRRRAKRVRATRLYARRDTQETQRAGAARALTASMGTAFAGRRRGHRLPYPRAVRAPLVLPVWRTTAHEHYLLILVRVRGRKKSPSWLHCGRDVQRPPDWRGVGSGRGSPRPSSAATEQMQG